MTSLVPLSLQYDAALLTPSIEAIDWSSWLSDRESSDEAWSSPLSVENSSDCSPTRADACARRRARRAISARRRREKYKNELDSLRAQVETLEGQHATLRSQRAVTDWCEQAAVQQRKRLEAEAENAQLKLKLAAIRTNALDLGHFLSAGFLNAGVNMRDLLHTYTHLTQDPRARERDYLSICTQQKMDLAFDIVTRETRRLGLLSPGIHVQQVASRPGEIAVTCSTHVALDTTDLALAHDVAVRAYLACYVEWMSFRQLERTVRAKEIPAPDSQYTVVEAQHASESTGEVVVFEETILTYGKLTETHGVHVWDFVDADELHPLNHAADARRSTVAGVAVRRELCDDGIERVLCSMVGTKTYEFLPNGKPIVALDTIATVSKLKSAVATASQTVLRSILQNTPHHPLPTAPMVFSC